MPNDEAIFITVTPQGFEDSSVEGYEYSELVPRLPSSTGCKLRACFAVKCVGVSGTATFFSARSFLSHSPADPPMIRADLD